MINSRVEGEGKEEYSQCLIDMDFWGMGRGECWDRVGGIHKLL